MSLEVLVDHLELKYNFVALQDKDDFKKASQVRYKRSMERLTFCWYCMSYHNQTHFCTTLKIWRKIDLGNLIVLSGHDRNSVDRYKDEFSIEHKVEVSLFRSRNQLNQSEQYSAEMWKLQQDEKKATKYFEKHKSRFEEMTHQASDEYLKTQNLGDQVQRFVQRKISSLQQEMQEMKDAEKWFKENVEMKYYWGKEEKYNEILRERDRDTSRRDMMNIVLERFEHKYGKPLQ